MVTRPRAVLIGPPGSGKTSTGQALAARLNLPFLDTDQVVEAEQQRAISEIFVEDGEAAFRALEADAVAHALTSHTGVLALGGGAPVQPGTDERLAGHVVVFLDVTITDAAKRVGFDGTRPLLAVNPRGQWTRMMRDRRPTYERLATVSVTTGGKTPDEVAGEVEQLLSDLSEGDES